MQSSLVRSVPVVATLLASSVLAGCGKGGGSAQAGGPPGGGAAAAAAVVSIAPAARGDINKTVDVTGSLVALQDVVVGTKIAGRLAQVLPHEGDSVSAGQIVAVMDTVELNGFVQQAQANLQAAYTKEQQARVALSQAWNQLQQAQTTLKWTDKTTQTAIAVSKSGVESAREHLAVVKKGARDQERAQAEEQVRSARANYDKAKSDLKRYQDLYREQVVSASQLDEKQAAFDSAQAQYNSAQQALSLIKEGARPEDIRSAEIAVRQAQDAQVKAEADRDTVHLRSEDVQSARVGVQSAQAGIRAAQAGVEQAKAALRIAQDNLSNSYIKSPIQGIVAERRAEPGQQLGGGGAVMRIVNPATVYFQAVLSESQFADVKLNQTATVTVDAIPGRRFSGRVTRVLPVASMAARSFSIRIDITPDVRLRPQMFARGEILIETHRDVTLIAKDAVLFDPSNGTAKVFTADSGAAKQRDVKTGLSDPKRIEILSGIQPGEKVIVAGQTGLQTGDPVRIAQQ